jgi:hypothetical protein
LSNNEIRKEMKGKEEQKNMEHKELTAI